MSEYDWDNYVDYLEKKYRGTTQVKNLVDLLYDIKPSKLHKVHSLYSKKLPPQPSRFKEMLTLVFNNPDLLGVVRVEQHCYKIFEHRLMHPETLADFINDCDRYGYRLFWQKEVYNEYLI